MFAIVNSLGSILFCHALLDLAPLIHRNVDAKTPRGHHHPENALPWPAYINNIISSCLGTEASLFHGLSLSLARCLARSLSLSQTLTSKNIKMPF